MEDSFNRKYINISNKKFVNRVYDESYDSPFSYKPANAFWLSLESKNPKYYSEWDEEYRETLETDSEGKLHATTFMIKPNTYVMSPSIDSAILEGFYSFTKGKNLTPCQKRRLLVELVKERKNKPEIEHIICQVDLVEDLMEIERIFAGYKLGEKHSDEVYNNLATNVRNAFGENFAGVEVTAYALGLDEIDPEEGIDDVQVYWNSIDSKYNETIEFWDMHSLAIFDTSCLEKVSELTYYPKEKNIDSDERDD